MTSRLDHCAHRRFLLAEGGLPTALGEHPSKTIAALAERDVEQLVAVGRG